MILGGSFASEDVMTEPSCGGYEARRLQLSNLTNLAEVDGSLPREITQAHTCTHTDKCLCVSLNAVHKGLFVHTQ